MIVVLLSTDLAVQSRVEGAALANGKRLRVAGTAALASEICHDQGAELVLVDLATSSAGLPELITRLHAGAPTPVEVIAFGPHVHEQKLAAARDAGCDVVLSRGQFFSQLDKLLSR
jgi:hypothetical protein